MMAIIKTFLSFLILVLMSNAALCNGPEGLRNEFFYAALADGIPYLIFNNVQKLYGIQSALLNKGPYYYKLKLMLESPDVYRAGVPCLFEGFSAFEITGDSDPYDNLIRLRRGDVMVIEKAAMKGDGLGIGVTIDKVMFLSNGWTSSIVIRCREVKEDEIELLKPDKWTDHFVAYYAGGRGAGKDEKGEIQTPAVPVVVKEKIDELAEGYLPPGNPDEYPYPCVTTAPIRWEGETILYAAVLSHGDKTVEGKLFLLDGDGNTVQETPEKNYNRIIGVVGRGGRGPQSLVVFYGGGYGGGVELFAFERQKQRLVSRFRVCTVID